MAKKALTQDTTDYENITPLDPIVEDQSTALQPLFDKGGKDQATFMNATLLVELASETLNESGSFTIGHNSPEITANNVGDALEEVLETAKEAQAGTIIDGSIADVKLSNSTGQIKDRVATNTTDIAGKATEETYTATVTATWTGSEAPFTQVVAVVGMLATDNPIVDVELDAVYATALLERDAYSKIEKIITSIDQITVYSDEATTQAFNIQLKVVR